MALNLGQCMGGTATLPHNRAIGRNSRHKLFQQHPYYVLKMRVNDFWTCIMQNPRAAGRH
jgi:hypothetical protein